MNLSVLVDSDSEDTCRKSGPPGNTDSKVFKRRFQFFTSKLFAKNERYEYDRSEERDINLVRAQETLQYQKKRGWDSCQEELDSIFEKSVAAYDEKLDDLIEVVEQQLLHYRNRMRKKPTKPINVVTPDASDVEFLITRLRAPGDDSRRSRGTPVPIVEPPKKKRFGPPALPSLSQEELEADIALLKGSSK